MRKTSLVLAVLLAVAGMCVMLWPVFTGNRLQSSARSASLQPAYLCRKAIRSC